MTLQILRYNTFRYRPVSFYMYSNFCWNLRGSCSTVSTSILFYYLMPKYLLCYRLLLWSWRLLHETALWCLRGLEIQRQILRVWFSWQQSSGVECQRDIFDISVRWPSKWNNPRSWHQSCKVPSNYYRLLYDGRPTNHRLKCRSSLSWAFSTAIKVTTTAV